MKNPQQHRRVYWNSKQLEFLRTVRPYMLFLGGRGSGKTTSEGGWQYQYMQQMPRSRGFLASSTYAQLLNSTLPAVTAKWSEIGLIEGVDYVIGLKPPKGFEMSFSEPRDYRHVISFRNGRRVLMMSMDRPDTQRGGSYTDGAIDEAALVAHNHITKVLGATLRGYVMNYPRNPMLHCLRAYTSIPWKPTGFWVFDWEEKAKSMPDTYKFVESSAMDNIHVLGPDYMARMEAEMPYFEYCVEILNMRVRKARDGFYHNFDPERHTYSPQWSYGEGDTGLEVAALRDPHYDSARLLDVSFDFSGWFNCATVFQAGKDAQTKRDVEYLVHQFFVKQDEGKVAELVDKMCQHYTRHKSKLVRLWGEPRGHDKRADTLLSIYQQIEARFKANGWGVEIRVKPGQVKAHKERHYYMSDLMAEQGKLPLLRINDSTAKDVIIAMQMTEMTPDFEKDKSMEKERGAKQEHAPHFTDCIDYYLMQKHGHMVGFSSSRATLGAYVR